MPEIVVAARHGRFRGALRFGLQQALESRGRVSIVRAEHDPPLDLQVPVEVTVVPGSMSQSLLPASEPADVLVVEVPTDPACRASDPCLVEARRNADCLVVEVDARGSVVDVTGPDRGWMRPLVDRRGEPVVVVGRPDGASEHDEAVEWAREEARARRATLRVVTVLEDRDAPARKVATRAEVDGLVVESIRLRGEAVDVLVDQARHADLLVVGGHRTVGLLHSAMGGVGDACARLAACPVVIVPPHAHAGTDQNSLVPPPTA